MAIGNRLLDDSYRPNLPESKSAAFNFTKVIKCPVTFTTDPIEYTTKFLGYRLKPVQKIILEDLFFEDSDGVPEHKEAVFIAGMRSGKSVLGAIVGSFLLHKLLAMNSPGKDLGQAPGQKLTGEYIATSEMQSKQTAYAAFVNIITNTDWWVKYIAYLKERENDGREGKESLFLHHQRKIAFLEKNLEVLSLHSNSQSLAGLTAFFVCFDEMSRFDVSAGNVQEKSEKRTAQAVYYTAARAAKTLKTFAKILTITSPMYETDFGMQLLYMADTLKTGDSRAVIDALRSRYSSRVKGLLGYHYSTHEANPKTDEDPSGFTEDDFDVEKSANYATYMRDYLAIPPSAISPFFELPERIEQCVNKEQEKLVAFSDSIDRITVGNETRNYIAKAVHILNSNKMQKYFICCDQGAVKDSFTVAMGHAETAIARVPDAKGGFSETERHKVVIDFVEAWVPDKKERITVSFQNVEEVISVLSSQFYIDRVVFDQWHSTESIERLFAKGVITKKLSATLEMYETMKVLIYSGMVEFPESVKLLMELRQLNVVKGQAVDHPKEGCFTGDTKLRLLDGTTRTLKELADFGKENEFWVYSCLEDGTIVPAKAHNAHKTKEVTELVEVTLDNGKSFRCTPDHLWMKRDGTYASAENLQKNDSLMPLYRKVVSVKRIKFDKPVAVYDITVPQYENFALEDGTFVHNSKDLADAVCRVIWCVYLDSIRDAVHGHIMLPSGQKFPTVRSVGEAYETMKNDLRSDTPHYGVFPSGGSGGVFGKSMVVEPNVVPNIGDTKYK